MEFGVTILALRQINSARYNHLGIKRSVLTRKNVHFFECMFLLRRLKPLIVFGKTDL